MTSHHLNPSPGTSAGTVVPGEVTKANPVIGWGLLTVGAFCTYTAVAWSSPIPWQAQVAVYGMALAWPGDHSPRAALRALARARTSDVEPAPAQVSERAGGRMRVYVAGACVLVAVAVWVLAGWHWWVLGGLILALVADATWPLPGILVEPPALTLLNLSSGGGAEGLAQWRSELVDRWYDGVLAVPSLVLREAEDPDADEQGPRRIIGAAEIVGDEIHDVPGGVAFGVDTSRAMAVTDDVAASVERLRRILDATEVLVEPVPARASISLLTVYRGQPWHGRPPVDWRGLRPVDNRGLVPVGETAHADLLREDRPAKRGVRPVLSGRQALLSSRTSLLIVAASEAGKTGLVRAYLRGLLVQSIPFLPVVVDNKGDYRDLAAAVRAMGGIYVSNPDDYAAAVDWAYSIGESRYSDAIGFQHRPTLNAPQIQLVIAEWMDFVSWAKASKSMTTLRQAQDIPRRHRGSGINAITTAQAAQQELLTIARVFFPQAAVMRIRDADQTDMALGDDAYARGARPHLIPADAPGCFWAEDRRTGYPYQGRAAWIPEHDQTDALIRPMWELAKRMRTNTGTRETA